MMLQAERAAHCADVRPGKARVFTCLLAHIESEDYRPGCRDQLSAQQARRVSDWRLDYDLRQACKDDVPKVSSPLPGHPGTPLPAGWPNSHSRSTTKFHKLVCILRLVRL